MQGLVCDVHKAAFLNQMHTWFLEIAFACDVSMCVCLCVCVYMCVCVRPQGYKLHSCHIEPVQPAEQVCCI